MERRPEEWSGPSARPIKSLGLIAGGGDLPRAVAESAREAGREVFVVALRGHVPATGSDDFPHDWISLGEPGRALKALPRRGRERCAAGGPGGPAEILRAQARCQGRDGAARGDRGGAQGR